MKILQPNARLVAEIPPQRFTLGKDDAARAPAIGDLVFVDQGWAAPDGRDMFLVYCQDADGRVRWEAELYEAELELLD